MKRCGKTHLWGLAVCFLLVVNLSCHSPESYVGTYQAVISSKGKNQENIITLLEDGEGTWACCDLQQEFSWYIKENELRIHTKEGGVMMGKLKNNTLAITLPGNKILTFRRIASEE